MTGNDLLERLTSSEPMQYAHGIGYVLGAADMPSNEHCMPNGVTARQMRDLIVAMLLENPSLRHNSAIGFVRAAYARAYPCAKSKKNDML